MKARAIKKRASLKRKRRIAFDDYLLKITGRVSKRFLGRIDEIIGNYFIRFKNRLDQILAGGVVHES